MSAMRILAAVAAVAVAAFAIWRRRKLSRERFVIALLVAVALGVYASGVLSALPDPKEAIGDIAEALGPWTYVLVALLAFLETGAFVGLVAPGETVVIAGGVIAGQGEIDLIPLVGIVWLCAILGDSTSFYIGRRLGRKFLLKHGPKLKITEARLEQVEGYFERHGGKTILIGRFIGLVRALAPFIAGSSGLSYRRFIPFSVVGTGLWATTFAVLGYVFWQSFDTVAHVAGQAVFAFGVVAGTIFGVVYAYRRLRKPEERRKLEAWLERQERKPALKPLFRVGRPIWRRVISPVVRLLGPRLRFLWDRLTPGELGLELTTGLAVAATGLYVFVLYTFVVSDTPDATGLDREVFDLCHTFFNRTAIDVAKVATDVGALPTVATLVVASSVLLFARRRPVEAIALLTGLVLTWVAVQVAKAGVDRPRPTGFFVDTKGSSFPSGHAAYSTAWVAVAVALSWRLGLVRQGALVLVGLAIASVVGATRVYLRAHFYSDVVAGWGLGFGIFGLLGVIALLVVHMRQNERAS